jgi:hypothetical protein
MVTELRENLLADKERGEAHRNHENPAKCRHCVRREHCLERLA